MPDFLNIGVSALLATQRAISTVGHNIANVNTDGYTRQRVQISQLPPQFVSGGFQGKGVSASAITRSADDFLTNQVRLATSNEAKASTYYDLANQVDQLLGNGSFSPALQKFFTTLSDVNNDPSSAATRQVFLSTAQDLVARFKDTDNQLQLMAQNVNQKISGSIDQINGLTDSIARMNRDIVIAMGLGQGSEPNDLMDQRDSLIKQISAMVNVSTLQQEDGAVNVFMGNGHILVNGGITQPLSAVPNPLDGARTEVATVVGGVTTVLSNTISTGSLGGVLTFRDQVLDVARNALGRLSAGMAFTFNAQHQEGMDLNGALGGAFFTVGAPQVNSGTGNTGTVTVALDQANSPNLTTSDYLLRYTGANFVLTRIADGNQQTLAGAGPFNVDGMTITVGVAPAAGDVYRIEPTKYVVGQMNTAITDTAKIAIASPLKSAYASTNIGNGTISAPTVTDITNPNVLTPATISFVAGGYRINGAAPTIAYTSGADIVGPGWTVKVFGVPQLGDSFTVGSNAGGKGDNANGLLLAGLQNAKLLVGGTATYQDTFNLTVGGTATLTQQAKTNQAALKTLRENAESLRDAQAGVNLDEEAADLLKFQQAYEAAAHMITAASTTFDALMAALRG
ncbi:MAG: flagellar hook-associated protein FlgK [Gammaproteobacteria bacterium]|nr:flagellar hook-associated protein FlgK [Gammaproteobacteria bacterium]